jgi:predicted DNA-binding transcriptional regulator YafY
MKEKSHRGDLTARMIELQLLLTDGGRSQRELIEHFRVDRKTIKRAIDALSIHYQITEEPDGHEIRYCFSKDYKFTRPHKKLTEWARQMLLQVKRWLPGRGWSSSLTAALPHSNCSRHCAGR